MSRSRTPYPGHARSIARNEEKILSRILQLFQVYCNCCKNLTIVTRTLQMLQESCNPYRMTGTVPTKDQAPRLAIRHQWPLTRRGNSALRYSKTLPKRTDLRRPELLGPRTKRYAGFPLTTAISTTTSSNTWSRAEKSVQSFGTAGQSTISSPSH